MSTEVESKFAEIFFEYHQKELRALGDHILKNFRGEVDVISGKLDRLRERVDTLESLLTPKASDEAEL